MKKLAIYFALAALILWLGVPSIKQAIKIENGKRCKENITYIENGKNRYIENFTIPADDGNHSAPPNPNRFMDIIPFMPLKNIPECPSGKPYLNVLDLEHQTTCQVNGMEDYEADTPGTDLTRNGFHDSAKEATYTGWWEVPLKMLHLNSTPTSPFETPN